MSTGAHWWQVKISPGHQKLTNISLLGESYQSVIRSLNFVPYLFSETATGDMKIILKYNKLYKLQQTRKDAFGFSKGLVHGLMCGILLFLA